MAKSIRISVMFICLLTMVNIVAGLINQKLNYNGQLKDVPGIIPLHIFFGLLFCFTFYIRTKVSLSLRLPLFHIAFLTLIVLIGIWGDRRMVADDFLIANSHAISFFFTTISLTINQFDVAFLNNSYFVFFGINIIGVALYLVLVIKASILIHKSFYRNH